MKKGQVTIFIILGILLVISVGILLYYTVFQIKVPDITPPQYLPVKNYVEACVSDISQEAIIELGAHGGYISVPWQIAKDRSAYLAVDRRSLLKIPYWYHNGNNVYPTIPYMESEINRYVAENLNNCLKDFKPLDKMFEVNPKGVPEVVTSIGAESTVIEVKYLLNVKAIGEKQSSYIDKFQYVSKVKLGKMYDLALKILEAENDAQFFENATINLMAMDEKIPFTMMELSCSRKQWMQEDIDKEIKRLIYYSTPRWRVQDTNYVPFDAPESTYRYLGSFELKDLYEGKYPKEEAPDDAYDYFHHLFDVNTEKTPLKVGFMYDQNWDLNLKIRPSEGGILGSNPARGDQEFLSFLCFNIYHFTYDLSYPLMIVIKDEDAFSKSGYSFKIAMPVIIDHNQPNRKVTGTTLFESYTVNFDYCGQMGETEYDIRAIGTDESGISGVELSEVNISYDCLKFICPLGHTAPTEGVYKLKTKLPSACQGGYIIAEKEGYLRAKQQFLGEDVTLVPMKKLKKLDFTVLKNKYYNIAPSHLDLSASELGKNDRVVLILSSYDDPDYSMVREYPIPEDATEQTIDILEMDSTYYLNLIMLDRSDNIIGGYLGNWSVRWNDVADATEAVFHVVEYIPTPVKLEETYSAINYLQGNTTYREPLKPELR